LSNEAQESRSRDCRYISKSHSRNISQSSTNEDIFNLLPVSSDPLISSLRKLPSKAVKTYLTEALKSFSIPKEMEDLISSDVNYYRRGF